MKALTGLISGIIFAVGLSLSGMINPDKVIGFLDLFGSWDPTLAFVMGGAVAFNWFSFMWLKGLQRPAYEDKFHWPTKTDIDSRLVLGAALFGIGWGLAGICPGPGIANLVSLQPGALIFVGSMCGGILVTNILKKP